MAQEVVIEFLADYSSLDTAIDQLEKIGAVDKNLATAFKSTTAEINKQSTALKKTSDAVKDPIKSLEQLDKKSKSFVKNFVEGFEEGVNEALQEAGVSMNEFLGALKNAGEKGIKPVTSLRQELKNLTQEIATAKASGGPVDPEMIKRAGQLKDAISDANREIANVGSDTRTLDNIVGSVSALAGGYSALQGAAALFGDENEDLQRSLLKVNSAMALATGLQQVFNALQREGSLVMLANTVATKAQVVVQQLYTAVTGKATAATIGFKVALATTGIGAAVLLVLTLVDAFKSYNNVLEKSNELLDKQKRDLEDFTRDLDISTRNRVAAAQAAGESEEEITRIMEVEIIRRKSLIQSQNAELVKTRDIYKQLKETIQEFGGSTKDVDKALDNLNIQIKENNNSLAELNTSQNELNSRETVRLRKQAEEDAEKRKALAEKAAADDKARREKALQEAREARARDFEDFKAKKELELLKTKEGSEEQLAARKALLQAQLSIDLEGEKLTDNQKRLLIQKFFKDRLDLEKQFAKDRDTVILSNIASDLNAELQSLNLTNEKKLELTETAIRVASELEILAAEGNASKIAEINAKRDKAIRDARLASLNEITEREIQLSEANDGVKKRALDRVANDEKKNAEVRINAINQLLNAELDLIQKRIDANQKAFDEGLISQEDYNLKSAQLNDQYNQAWETAEQKRTDITKKENEKRRESNRKMVEDIIAVTSEIVGILSELYANQSAAEAERINAQKRQLDALLEAGAITEKEAITRQKRIEAEERKAKNRQAQRDKQIAVFNALLAIPQAILQGLRQGGPVLAAIYGALAAVQAGIVISRPVPKFAKGKKDSYSGLGMVGEAGTEMIERNGRLFITTKPTITYLGPKDKVFTHAETKRLMPSVNKSAMTKSESGIDYDKLAAKLADAISRQYKPTPGTSINIDKEFISESVANGLSKNNYFDRYYSSNGH